MGLEGTEEGAESGVDVDPERTTIVSTIPIMRAASVSVGPEPLQSREKKELLCIKLEKETGGLR